MADGPYAQAAATYLQKGWSPIPLPALAKTPPPTGTTGYDGRYVTGPDVYEWAQNGKGNGNVALRMPEEIIGVDVDAYGMKRGDETLAEWEARVGALPPTYRSTSRMDGKSGIRLFRVPAGRVWADVLGPDVEVIHYGHRYAVVAPSIHPETGLPYVWLLETSSGLVQVSAPKVSDVVAMPEACWRNLDRGSYADHLKKAAVDVGEALRSLEAYPQGPICQVIEREVTRARTELATATSRHDTARQIIAAVVRAGERGHNGSMEALGLVHEMWTAALQFGERRVPDAGEFERMVTGAVAIVKASPTDPSDIGCCGSVLHEVQMFDPTGEAAFWKARPELEVIEQMSRARMMAKWGVLMTVLVRVTTAIPPHVRLPALVGGEASLNLFAALVGKSGAGKGGVEAVAAAAVVLPEIHQANIGSGEGITHLYKRRNRQGILEPIRDAVLFSVSEIDTMTALGQRQGSTLLSQLRKAWMGEHLGFSNADQHRTVPLKAHGYRMGLILGVQPEKSAALIRDGDGGTPQRFIYAWVIDRSTPRPENRPPEPSPYVWKLRERLWAPTDRIPFIEVGMDEQIAAEVLENRWRQTQGDGHALDGHLMLCRLKVAAALAILNGRLNVDLEDWALSAVVMAHSTSVRNELERFLGDVDRQSNLARGRAQAERADVEDETRHARKKERIGKRVVIIFGQATELLSMRGVKALVSSRDRDAVPEVVAGLIEAGQIRVYETENGTRYGQVDKL